jgi:Fe-S oxidoreductase
MRSIAEQAIELTIHLGGATTGEHGDGIARSEWLERSYGKEIVALFRNLKRIADPHGILNPGKIIDAPSMDTHLRYGKDYHTQEWQTVLDFSRQGSLSGAIEICNGAGVCRKADGVMCPSFQTTQDEMFATRGRSNLLRALISTDPTSPLAKQFTKATYDALDLCLACKGCKSECPSTVDMAKLKYEFMNHYYSVAPFKRRLRDYLFGYIGNLAPIGALFAPLVNFVLSIPLVKTLNYYILGLTTQRSFPRFSSIQPKQPILEQSQLPDCLFLTDTFSRYFHPETEESGLRVLKAAGLHVKVLPIIGAGRTLISKGFLKSARNHAARLIKSIRAVDPTGKLPVVGVEPSEILTLRDEFLDFFPNDDYVKALAKRAWMIDEILIRPGKDGKTLIQHVIEEKGSASVPLKRVLLHGHCYQKAQPPADDGYSIGVNAAVEVLQTAGYQVEVIDSGCCGMAGAFGYESEHFDMSIKIGEMALFPAVRINGKDMIIAAAGTSCRSQIEDGTQHKAVHPIVLI